MTNILLKEKDENESFIEDLQDLLSLDYAAVDAYDVAIEKLSNEAYKDKLREFKEDHQDHIKNITNFLKKGGYDFPTGAGLKAILTEGKVFLANLISDDTILMAMKSNEQQTTKAYKGINKYEEMPDAIKKHLMKGYEDEEKHLSWIESKMK